MCYLNFAEERVRRKTRGGQSLMLQRCFLGSSAQYTSRKGLQTLCTRYSLPELLNPWSLPHGSTEGSAPSWEMHLNFEKLHLQCGIPAGWVLF